MIVTKLGQWAQAFLEWVGPLIPPLLRQLVSLLVDVGRWVLTTALPTLISLVARWAAALVDWVIDVAPDVLRELGILIADAASALADGALQLGIDLVNAIVDGIRSVGGRIGSALTSLLPGSGLLSGLSGFVPGLAAGGPVSAGSPYIVGETGPELFVPTGSGTIMSNNRLSGLAGGGTVNVTVNMPAGSNGDDVVRALQDYVRRRGAIPVPVGTARY
jgi:hypothetical protein